MAFFPDLKVSFSFGFKEHMPAQARCHDTRIFMVRPQFVGGNRYPDHLFPSARLIVIPHCASGSPMARSADTGSCSKSHPLHPVPNVRDDRETPLWLDGMARVVEMIWVRRAANYF
jgi:hypothetical protein